MRLARRIIFRFKIVHEPLLCIFNNGRKNLIVATRQPHKFTKRESAFVLSAPHGLVRAEVELSHRADRELIRGWGPTG